VAVLIDTSILARLANSADAHHAVADRAVIELHRRGELLHIAPQNLIEFRAVATRPITANGLGLDLVATEAKAAIFEATFALLPDTPDIFLAWKSLVATAGVIGKRVHDARLVACCHVHRVGSLLTFNVQDFAGLSLVAPRLAIIDPATV
jgi:predicted nucleic acid-binding protein